MRDERARNTSAAALADIQERHRAGRRADASMRSKCAKRSRETCITTNERPQLWAKPVRNTPPEGSQHKTGRFANHDRKVRNTRQEGSRDVRWWPVAPRRGARTQQGATQDRKPRNTRPEGSQHTPGRFATHDRKSRQNTAGRFETRSRKVRNTQAACVETATRMRSERCRFSRLANRCGRRWPRRSQGRLYEDNRPCNQGRVKRTATQHATYLRRRGSTHHHRVGLCRCVRAHRSAHCALAHGCFPALARRGANASSLPGAQCRTHARACDFTSTLGTL